MTLIVEDGTVKEGANSYASLEDAEAFHEARQNAGWSKSTVTDEQREAALIYATLWIDRGPWRWVGEVSTTGTNRLAWPRTNAYGPDLQLFTGIPQDLKDATCELAAYHLRSSLNKAKSNGQAVTWVRIGEMWLQYDGFPSQQRAFPAVRKMLKRLTRSRGSGLQRHVRRG